MKNKKDIKLKYYLRGLGTGIVITTLVLTISFNVRSCTAKDNKEETTTKEISVKDKTKESTSKDKETKESVTEDDTTKEKETKEKETKEKETKEKDTKEKETKEKETKEKTTEEKTTKEKTTEEKTTKEKQTEETTEAPTTEPPSTEAPTTDNVVDNQTVTFDIWRGMSSERVSAELEQAGLVDSANDFNKYLYQMGYERILRVGTYEIEKGASYEEIARMITN